MDLDTWNLCMAAVVDDQPGLPPERFDHFRGSGTLEPTANGLVWVPAGPYAHLTYQVKIDHPRGAHRRALARQRARDGQRHASRDGRDARRGGVRRHSAARLDQPAGALHSRDGRGTDEPNGGGRCGEPVESDVGRAECGCDGWSMYGQLGVSESEYHIHGVDGQSGRKCG